MGATSVVRASLVLAALVSPAVRGDEPAPAPLPVGQFVNPIGEGADPWVVRDPASGDYLWCFSDANRGIAVSRSTSPIRMGLKRVIWQAPAAGPAAREVWAPELHLLDGRWHVYFAASDGKNENHQAFVLQSEGTDPFGPYALHGPFRTGLTAAEDDPPIWAIDMTVLQHGQRRYAIWSGWDVPGSDRQYLYIAEMESPLRLKTDRVRICSNDDHDWERVEPGPGHRGLNEGPQVFQQQGRTWLVYSCGASWLPTYKLGMLELTGDDPLDPQAWKKHPAPVFQGTEDTSGVGHSCWVPSVDGREWWHVFHAKHDRAPGWRRAIFAQPLEIGADGRPRFGDPVAPGQPLAAPSGDATVRFDGTPDFSLYGHHQFFERIEGGFRLGRRPQTPINEYRSGEKLVDATLAPDDFEATVEIEFHDGARSRDAGLLFRCTGPAVGYDAQRAYFAGLNPRSGLVILGRTDGSRWQELARAPAAIDPGRPQQLGVRMVGDAIEVLHDGRVAVSHRDAAYPTGSLGLRVVDTDASFRRLRVRALPD